MNSLPNIVSLLNLFCGCLSLTFLLGGEYGLFFLFIATALVLDFLDGFLARALNATSELGAQLDSLSDMMSFGVVPGFVLYELGQVFDFNIYASAFSFVFTLAAAYRLARFNIEPAAKGYFSGMATPIAATAIFGMLLAAWQVPEITSAYLKGPYLLIGINLVLSILMVSRLPFFNFKVKSPTWRGNEIRIAFVILSIALVVLFRYWSIILIVLLYIILSLIFRKQFIK